MQSHRQRFGHRRLAIAHMVGHGMGLPGLDHHLLPKRALDVRPRHGTAVEPHVQAMAVLTLLAKHAVATRPAGADGHPCADADALHLRTHGHHLARHLVAQHHGLLDPHRAKATMLVVMQV